MQSVSYTNKKIIVWVPAVAAGGAGFTNILVGQQGENENEAARRLRRHQGSTSADRLNSYGAGAAAESPPLPTPAARRR